MKNIDMLNNKNIFILVKEFKHYELRTKLRELLYDPRPYNPNLTCADNGDKTVACPNGFCRLVAVELNTVDRQCVPAGDMANPSGVMIGPNSMEGSNFDPFYTYACNKQMCNDRETLEKVRKLLREYRFLSQFQSPVVVQSTTKASSGSNMTVAPLFTTTSTGMKTLSHILLVIPWLLFQHFY